MKKILVAAAFAVAMLTGTAAPAYADSDNIYTCSSIAKDGSSVTWRFNLTNEEAQQFKKSFPATDFKTTCVKDRDS
jgi:hypothetical protein